MSRMAPRLIAVLGMILSFAVVAPAAQATFPGKNGKLTLTHVFANGDPSDDGNYSGAVVTSVNLDGSQTTLLGGGTSESGQWSPDGRRVAFQTGLSLNCCHSLPSIEVVNA